jgi:hypothetical protein
VSSIANMTTDDLRRFIVNLLASDPGALPKTAPVDPKTLMPSFHSDGDIPIWNEARQRWITKKLAVGSGTLTWPGGTQISNTGTVAHGLGVTPVGYTFTIEGLSNPDFVYAWQAADATNLYPQGANPFGLQGAGSKTIYWIAIA